MTDTAVALRDVTKIFDAKDGAGVTAVKDVNLGIRRGEFFTLLGPSGCGKTTTLRMVAGFEMPTTGEVFIDGESMQGVPPYRRPVNMVFQNYALFPHLSVAGNIGFGLAVKRVSRDERRRRIEEMLELVQLPGMGDRKPSQLSGGQQQRVALARALINRPAVLLLDEPLGALDLKLRKQMQIELKHLQDQVGITFVYVTHDQEEALTMSDRIAVMHAGKVLQVGDPVSIYEKPATRFVADFIGETNFLSATIEDVDGDVLQLAIAGQHVAARAGDEQQVAPGQTITLTIRPEKLSLDPVNTGSSGLTGTIQEVIYSGTDTRYVVELPSGEEIAAQIRNRAGQGLGQFEAGDTVNIHWAVEDAWTLNETS